MSERITSLTQVTEYPLCWPPTKPRASRRESDPWKARMASAQAKIETEMRLVGARGWVVSMAPAYFKGPRDPAVALWFNAKPKGPNLPAELRVLACDKYEKAEGNLHAIGLTLDRLRALERYGAYTVEQAMEGARIALPPPPGPDGPPWFDVLGVGREWPLEAIEALWRVKAEKAHPDRGGSTDEMAALNAAMDAARKEKTG